MKKIRSWIALIMPIVSMVLLIGSVILHFVTDIKTTPFLIAAALCWGYSFVLFLLHGQESREKARERFGVSVLLLVGGLLVCLISCVLFVVFPK